ncbi:hypothetical protein D8674_039574 [Pyrus ussuriensis x Pyrus communis]|uniref:Secreted protein n=1 Tax=Pyrus ussuriensis x Pyrus communis TaxID=2448454 RepID=A0A5N5FT37_9ROSA|nr:hypothetical protein D8674_039574 [Pyrus ussuriensis x Pyrus communis]
MLHGTMEVCGALWLLYVQLHIPTCFGGLSVAAHLLHEPTLDPQKSKYAACTPSISLSNFLLAMQAISLLEELIAALLLLQSTAKPQ